MIGKGEGKEWKWQGWWRYCLAKEDGTGDMYARSIPTDIPYRTFCSPVWWPRTGENTEMSNKVYILSQWLQCFHYFFNQSSLHLTTLTSWTIYVTSVQVYRLPDTNRKWHSSESSEWTTSQILHLLLNVTFILTSFMECSSSNRS